MDNDGISNNSLKKPVVLREYEFFGGSIRVKISVKNTSSIAILDTALDLDIDDKVLHFERFEPEYPEKKGKLILGNIKPNTDRTISLYLDPLICAKEGTDVNCRVDFSYASGKPDSVHMESLKISVVCPVFHTEDHINIGRLKELRDGLAFHDSKVYTIQKRIETPEILGTCRDVILLHDVRHIKTFKTVDDKTHEAWYYGKTKITKRDLVIKCSIVQDTGSIEVFAAGETPADITGLLAEIGRNLAREFEKLGKIQPVFNIHIKDSIIQRSNLLSFCDLDGNCGGDVVIEDSVVQRSNIASGNEVKLREERQEEEILQEQREKERLEEAWKETERKAREALAEKERQDELRKQEAQRAEQAKAERERTKEEVERFHRYQEKKENERKARDIWDNSTKTIKIKPAHFEKGGFLGLKTKKVEIENEIEVRNNSIGMKFTHVPAGEFMMGSPDDEKGRWADESPVHKVNISKPFYLGTYPVTQREWKAVMGDNPSNFKGDELPVEKVSWYDVQNFIKKLNEKEGVDKYRLPSEAEWEYACRARTTTRYSFGADEGKLGEYAWYVENSGSRPPNKGDFDGYDKDDLFSDKWNGNTHPVGQKKPNPWGFYDMHGNVWEWVQDGWCGDYKGANILFLAGSLQARVNRGGCWHDSAKYCRSARRANCDIPGVRDLGLGFRLLREM